MPLGVLGAVLALPAFAGSLHCSTPEYLARRDAPPDSERVGRPGEAGFVDSALYPLRIHYADPGDATKAENTWLPMAEDVYAIEILQMGWPEPPPDNGAGGSDAYDLYFTEQDTFGGAYCSGFGSDVTDGDDWYSNTSYVAVDDRVGDADMESFIAHEYNHASQYTIDAVEKTTFVWEATAEAMADMVYDQTEYGYELYSFQQLPFESLLFDSYSPELQSYGYAGYFYEYGGMLFTTYLEERYGTKDGTTLLKMWENLAQPTRQDEPDFLDAVAMVDPSAPTVADVYTDFALWRMFAASNDDGAHFEEGASFPDYAIPLVEDTIHLAGLDGYSASPAIKPYDLGTSYYLIDLGDGTDQFLHAELDGAENTQWGLAWAVWQNGNAPAVTGTTWVAAGEPLSVDIDLKGGYQAEIGVVNTGPDGMDPEDDVPKVRDFTLNLTLVDAPAPGATTAGTTGGTGTGVGDAEVSSGCGCDGTGSGGSTWLFGAAGLLAVRRRRSPIGLWRSRF